MGLFRSILFLVLISWLAYRAFVIVTFLVAHGVGTTIAFNHAPGPCKTFYTNGSEDIDVLPSGLAIISSGLKYQVGLNKPDARLKNVNGKIYAYDFNNPNAVLTEFTIQDFDNSDFVPHGIDTYTDIHTGQSVLYVINHGKNMEAIEVFEIDETNLVLFHKKTIRDEKIFKPNDIVVVGPDSFYITNDCYFLNKILHFIESFYPLKLGSVVFYRNGVSKVVDSGRMIIPNGINSDKSGRHIFVADCGTQSFHVFERLDDDSLQHKQVVFVGATLDNIFTDESGSLWIGSPSFDIFEHSQNFSKPCATKVINAKLVELNNVSNDGPAFEVADIREVFASDGKGDIKCISSAAFYNNKLLAGTVYGNLMYCDVNEY